MVLLRRVIGDALRARRQGQHRTLREVSTAANVSLGYLSEIERGQKEASSELLAAICEALGARLSEVLGEVSDTLALAEGMDGVLVPVETAPTQSTGSNAAETPVKAAAAAKMASAAGKIAQRASGAGKIAQPSTVIAQPATAGAIAQPATTGKIGQPAPAGAKMAQQVTTDGTVSVSVRQDTPLKATLRTRRKRDRDVVYAA
ncbi:hypothetical protein Asp14428_62920 [Actinoplanes sp. NBRC 14428]|uniref:Helix-turn-helix protein n=1 Tax=Pseudosporangium ferrugineum TaxID=439699 RepID=A0A2T0RTR2_9ACTN|nr:helix-turn-helix transcriptional regulator [Pseudosporangium ferrugineum]PRY24575.1 helix-turn-helix protein [Pseudosporangium ferrugineum]BCJ54817.1 hypothetical protein Asp14428_62920 [Actinoplanes sp. NBRC 14428]